MRKWFNIILAIAASFSAPFLQAWEADGVAHVSLAYRQDNQSWTFKIPSRNPKIRSSISLDEVHILDLGLHYRTVVQNCFYLRARGNWGWVLDGDAREKVTNFGNKHGKHGGISGGDSQASFNRGSDWSFVENSSRGRTTSLLDGRYTADADVAFGYPVHFCCCTLRVSPLVGYGYHEQNYRYENNKHVGFVEEDSAMPIRESENAVPKGQGLGVRRNKSSDNKFVSRWWGPFFGVDIDYNPGNCWYLYSQIELHWNHFKGQRHSSTGVRSLDNFQKSTHHAHGVYFKLGFDYELCDCWLVGLFGTYEDFTAHKSSSKKVARNSKQGDFNSEEQYKNADFVAEITPALRFVARRHGYSVGIKAGRVF